MTNLPPELLAPAGNWECAKAAVENGADAIYFGLETFNARMRADNFTEADLLELMAFLHQRGVKGYVTFNTLIFTQELEAAQRYLRSIITAGVDAAIVQDVGICRLIRHLSPDFPIHASTQMTVTSTAGVEFARSLGCNLVVLARECSLKEINKIQEELHSRQTALPLEVFVHGALCVAYSGQCLTSEALGGRSANRGECAQACRMPYETIVDGKLLDLGDKKYLLSPQDLSGLELLPQLIAAGISSLKIEGRLKNPEYVASVTNIYRQAIDRLKTNLTYQTTSQEHYELEMAFSRGLSTGWFEGIDNQKLVRGRFGKKRGVFLGKIIQVRDGKDQEVLLKLQAPLKPGDGVVFDSGHPEAKEEGGRVYTVKTQGQITSVSFGKRDVDLRRVKVGDLLWKTSDPELNQKIRKTFSNEQPQYQRGINLEIYGELGEHLTAIARDEIGNIVKVTSTMPLIEAYNQQLTTERLQQQFGRLGNTPFYLAQLTNQLSGHLLLPIGELNRLRREIVDRLQQLRSQPQKWQLNPNASYRQILPISSKVETLHSDNPEIIILIRHLNQLEPVLAMGIKTLYCELENPAHYREAVKQTRKISPETTIWVAPPRISKPKENYILKQIIASNADGYLVRNYDHLQFFAQEKCIGDFSLNIANPIAAEYFKNTFNLERLTASYDLNINQLEALILNCPAEWLEITIHQHMPMFHMEHCVFCAFLSTGNDFTNCGRPCEKHQVKIRDRAGAEHILLADAGCRNTVFNGTAQTGAEFIENLLSLGVKHFRLEFLNETPQEIKKTITNYQQLLQKNIKGSQLWKNLKLQNQLGVTRGTLK
jgi:putative protease